VTLRASTALIGDGTLPGLVARGFPIYIRVQTMTRDELFRRRNAGDAPFRFDAEVAGVFDDMIRRSIPGYAALVSLLPVISGRFSQPDTNIYDLGCSLGAATLAVAQTAAAGSHLIAVDQSPDMVERCRALLGDSQLCKTAEVRHGDARTTELSNASLVVMNFTLQFLPQAERPAMLTRIHDALLPGGALVLSEKLAFERDAERELLEGLHDDFRRRNGYSDLEIAQKRLALERVLYCDPEAVHLERLRQAGFDRVVPLFRALNFASWLALR
jgi:tRNA (cmo5U34)-methyltransferase